MGQGSAAAALNGVAEGGSMQLRVAKPQTPPENPQTLEAAEPPAWELIWTRRGFLHVYLLALKDLVDLSRKCGNEVPCKTP